MWGDNSHTNESGLAWNALSRRSEVERERETICIPISFYRSSSRGIVVINGNRQVFIYLLRNSSFAFAFSASFALFRRIFYRFVFSFFFFFHWQTISLVRAFVFLLMPNRMIRMHRIESIVCCHRRQKLSCTAAAQHIASEIDFTFRSCSFVWSIFLETNAKWTKSNRSLFIWVGFGSMICATAKKRT